MINTLAEAKIISGSILRNKEEAFALLDWMVMDLQCIDASANLFI